MLSKRKPGAESVVHGALFEHFSSKQGVMVRLCSCSSYMGSCMLLHQSFQTLSESLRFILSLSIQDDFRTRYYDGSPARYMQECLDSRKSPRGH